MNVLKCVPIHAMQVLIDKAAGCKDFEKAMAAVV
jgi:hypothetical protein